MLTVTFLGARGSCPISSPTTSSRYGGNTSSVCLQGDADEPPLLLDLGTGARVLPEVVDSLFPLVSVLVSHLHFDHIQGLPFFPLVHSPSSQIRIYGPPGDPTLGDALAALVTPPYFPVRLDELPATIHLQEVWNERVTLGAAEVMVRPVPHIGPTVGYRVTWHGVTVAYLSDHQAPRGLDSVAEPVLELCADADLVIHDAQYSPEEFAQKPSWGHSTPQYAVLVARQAGARRLCLFHHDPWHDDDEIDRLLQCAQEESQHLDGPEVFAARENHRFVLPPP